MKRTRGVGRPSLYNPLLHPVIASFLARHGLTEPEIALELGVSLSSIQLWKLNHNEFRVAIKQNKVVSDKQVEDSLLRRATGYDYVEEVALQNGMIKQVTKHVNPDTTACIFWLCNRQREYWKHVNRVEHTGADGGAIAIQSTSDPNLLKGLTDKQLENIENVMKSIVGGEAIDVTPDS